MKKVLLKTAMLLPFLSMALTASHAQDWEWGKRGGGTGGQTSWSDKISDMTTDAAGNVYALSTVLAPQINIDNNPVTGYGLSDIAITSWTCDGAYRWTKLIGGSGSEVAFHIRADTLDGIYLTGTVVGFGTNAPVHVGGDTAIGQTNKQLFLAKFDTAGNYKWFHMMQPDTVSIAHQTKLLDMDVDGAGNVFILSILTPGNYSGTYAVPTRGMHVLRYNSTGAFIGGLAVGASFTISPTLDAGVYHDIYFKRNHGNGHFYIGGSFSEYAGGTLTFGTTNITRPMYLGAFDANGASLWVRQNTTPNMANIGITNRPVLDAVGNIYVSGNLYDADNFNGHAFANQLTVGTYPFVIKMDPDGVHLWAANSGTNASTRSESIVLSGNEVAIAGSYPGTLKWPGFADTLGNVNNQGADVFLTRFNTQTGAVTALEALQSNFGAFDNATVLTADRKGNFYMGGTFSVNLTVAGQVLTNTGGPSDWFVAKHGADNCDCSLPQAGFTAAGTSGNTVNFTYTGTMPYTDISWDFGNGTAPATIANPSHTYSTPGNYEVCVTVTNDCGSHTHCGSVVVGGTGIKDPGVFGSLKVFPNPTGGTLQLEGLQGSNVYRMYNSVGGTVLQGQLSAGIDFIDMKELPEGWYILVLQDKNGNTKYLKVARQ